MFNSCQPFIGCVFGHNLEKISLSSPHGIWKKKEKKRNLNKMAAAAAAIGQFPHAHMHACANVFSQISFGVILRKKRGRRITFGGKKKSKGAVMPLSNANARFPEMIRID